MEARILSLDPGTANLGFAILHGVMEPRSLRLVDFGVLKTKKADGDVRKRIDALGDGIRKLIAQYGPAYLAFEDFIEQGKLVGKTYKEMSWLIEHLRVLGRELGLETSIYKNAAWKRLTLKASGASKIQVMHYVSHKLPGADIALEGQPTHVWDAVGIGICEWGEILKRAGAKAR